MAVETPRDLVIGLSGYAQVGKDSVGRILVQDFGFKRFAFADALRELALKANPTVGEHHRPLVEVVNHLGWERAKNDVPGVRPFLQHLGVGCRDIFGDGVWVDALAMRVGNQHARQPVVITDVRFENEAEWITRGGDQVWRITRPGIEAINAHVSERALDGWDFDGHIVNDGSLDDLRKTVHMVMREAFGLHAF